MVENDASRGPMPDAYQHLRDFIRLYVLDGHEVREVESLGEWVASLAQGYENPGKEVVGHTTIGDARVHTNFWGVQHIPSSSDLWDGHRFETAVVRAGEPIEVVGRSDTWEDAEEMHRHTVERLRGEQV